MKTEWVRHINPDSFVLFQPRRNFIYDYICVGGLLALSGISSSLSNSRSGNSVTDGKLRFSPLTALNYVTHHLARLPNVNVRQRQRS